MENKVDIYNLLPEEIDEIIEKLTSALEIVKRRKNTNAKFATNIKEKRECPYCQSQHIVKNGHDRNKVQTYICKNCKKKFNASSMTLVAHIKLNYEQLLTFFECMNDKLSIRKTKEKMKVNKNTVFLLRHKVLDCISEIRKTMKLKGEVEADETYESINLKGSKRENMPRISKCRSSKGGSKRGVSNHQVCIASAIDEYDNCFLEIVGTGPITKEEVRSAFEDKVEDVTLFVTDCKSSYEKFIKRKNIRLEQVKSGTYVNANGYNLSHINSLHSEWTTFLSHFKGVSTKHLQHYLDWFCFQKLINYTTNILKQPLTMMKQSITNACSVDSNNVYDNSSGIDFQKVYADYR